MGIFDWGKNKEYEEYKQGMQKKGLRPLPESVWKKVKGGKIKTESGTTTPPKPPPKEKEGMGSVGKETTDAIRKRKKALQDAMKE